MGTTTRIGGALVCGALILSPTSRANAQMGGPPHAPRPIPGITAPDPFPGACVDCHTIQKERDLDVRISTLLEGWRTGATPGLVAKARAAAPGLPITGRHPDAKAALASIPAGCLGCHGRDSRTAPPFAVLMHGIHLTGGETNHYLGMFEGECVYCHKLDKASGRWSIPSRSEAQAGTALRNR